MAYSNWSNPGNSRFSALMGALLLSSALLVACGGDEDAASEAGAADTAAVADSAGAGGGAALSADDEGPKSGLSPNELGEILVLEYHRTGEPEGEFVRKAANFQKDLDSLYAAGFRPVTMRQVLEGDIDIPAGTSPVVFTIDDASRGQFYYRPDGSIDPNTMAGMWDAFAKKNPGWRNGAVWCVLPAAAHPSNFFGETPDRETPREQREATIKKKVDYLVQNRHEICNHTLYHARLDQASSDAQAQEWIGRGEDSIKVYLPADYDIVTFALPLGMWPKTRSLAWKGTWPGRAGQNRAVNYEYGAVLEVSGDANPSPFDVEFDPRSVDRFIVGPGRLERQLAAYRTNGANRYVSDGDPNVISVPQSLATRVDRNRWKGKEVKVVQGAAPAAKDSAAR
ncbi:MAG: hypothetical protein KY464_13465 [Gemmatimonadetes bacterium]|nr:hypothetical protein [Gemmatimonadota bacterium]